MSTTPLFPYDWVKQIDPSLLENDEIPLFGGPPTFPWEQFNQRLNEALKIEGLSVEAGEMNLVQHENILSGMGSPTEIIGVAISPLQGQAYFAVSKSDLTQLMTRLLVKGRSKLNIPDSFLEGFSQFFLGEVLFTLGKVDYDKSLTFNLTDHHHLPDTVCHILDLNLKYQDTALVGRLIIPSTLRLAWKEYYAPRKLHTAISASLAEKLPVIVHMEAGYVSLPLGDWKNVHAGDFIVLDNCSLEDGGSKGRVKLTVNGKSMFRAKLKDGSIKILENSLYHEVQTPMAKQPEDEDDEDFSFEETEFSDLEESEVEEDDESEVEEHSEVDLSIDEDQDNDDHDDDEDASEIEDDHHELVKPAKAPIKAQEAALKPQKASGASTKNVAPEEIPLNIVIEVGRLQMSIQKLMELQPGNMLELNVRPEDGVDLVVNGQTIAKGELLRIGETLGVRILDIG